MLILYVFSILCVATVLDRILFWLSSALKSLRIMPEVRRHKYAQRQGLIEKLQSKRCRHYLEELAYIILLKSNNSYSINQAASEQVELMSRHLGILELVAKVAPLVGILGTVVGMATSFGGIAAIANASPTAISSGISLALQTTAYGLIISIAASITQAGFKSVTRRASIKMGRIISEFFNTSNIS